MALKSIFALFGTGISAAYIGVVCAGGYDTYGQAFYVPYQPSVYFAFSAGYALSNWEEIDFPQSVIQALPAPVSDIDAETSGYTWGMFGGYQFFPYVAVELGGYSLFEGDRTITATDNSKLLPQELVEDEAKSFFIYGALKGILPLNNRVELYAKIGPTYRQVSHNNSCTAGNGVIFQPCDITLPTWDDGSYWTAFLAVGSEFQLTQNIGLGIQWYYVPSNEEGDYASQAPAINAFVGTLSFKVHL